MNEETLCVGTPSPSTLSSKLMNKRIHLEEELARIMKAEEILAENPKLKELFDIVSQVRCF